MSNLVKCGLELKMNWLNWSILISSGFQFQFNSNSKSFNSIPIQFMLNWIELIINSNSIHELIRALIRISRPHVLIIMPERVHMLGVCMHMWDAIEHRDIRHASGYPHLISRSDHVYHKGDGVVGISDQKCLELQSVIFWMMYHSTQPKACFILGGSCLQFYP